jgi:phosphatidylserine/phosphatidylglycerophosphate/cardiolipin synthase-like enzyme
MIKETKILKLESLTQFKEHIIKLLNTAENSVDMVSSLHPEFYNDSDIKTTIERCVERKVFFRILVDSRANIEALKSQVSWIFNLQKRHPQYLNMKRAMERCEHWIIIDNKHLRFEEEHIPSQRGERNLVVYNAPVEMVETVKNIYNNLWERAYKIP